MILDKVDGFDALAHYGIHVARSEYVDSPEGAIAFAARRTATDARMVPIVLWTVEAGVGAPGRRSAVSGSLEGVQAIRQAYAALAANLDLEQARVLAQEAVDAGTDIAIRGHVDRGHKVVVLGTVQHGAEHPIPLDGAAAETLVLNFRPYHHHGASEKNRRMLEHLLLRVSEFFANDDVERFELDPVRVHENTYAVLDASITARRPLHIAERLSHHARDAKEYGFRPSGTQ
jgi:hypothetical protein